MEGHFARKRYDLTAEPVRNDRLIDYMARLLTNRDSAKEIRIFSLRDLFFVALPTLSGHLPRR